MPGVQWLTVMTTVSPDFSPSFGRWVRRRRQALDLTQAQLAARAACSVALIRKVEGDERRLSNGSAQTIDFLSSNWRDVPLRHRSIRAAIDHSWALLATTEQRVL